MSVASIVILLIIFGWLAFLIYRWAKKKKAAKDALARGEFVCTGGCAGCSGIPSSSGCCGSQSFSPQECGALKALERMEALGLTEEECPHCKK
ncbi:MAG: FeoB-associated Cys-rich membrane protein [Anaerotardibacter sp.]